MLKHFKKIFQPRIRYQPLIEVRVFRAAILHNLRAYQTAFPGIKFAPVLKSNAYGHGLVQTAEILDGEDLAFMMADSFYEALVLRRAGIKSKILVLGYATREQLAKSRLKDVSFALIDLEQLRQISNTLHRRASFHLKIDTGMHRQGILVKDLDEAVRLIKANPNIELEGICSHFADADGPSLEFTRGQIAAWNRAAADFERNFPALKYVHVSNTAGAFYIPEIRQNVGRLGIGLYGFNISPFWQVSLMPALAMHSIITTIKTIPKGEKVGYNIMYTAPRDMTIATIPVGYNEGLDLRLSNRGYVKVKGQFCPIIGRISMNMCSVDVTDVSGVRLEDEVIVISDKPRDKNSIDSIIEICQATRYEVPIHIPSHLRRIIV